MSSKPHQKTATAKLIFPHQLFGRNPLLETEGTFFLIEEPLFFTQFAFHKQKLVFHRASMKFYEDFLKTSGYEVEYIDFGSDVADVRSLIPALEGRGYRHIEATDLTDDWLRSRICETVSKSRFEEIASPGFLNNRVDVDEYFSKRKRFFQADFYSHQRKQRGILLDEFGGPLGGKWSLDEENRKRFPKNATPSKVPMPDLNPYVREARDYVHRNFESNPGELESPIRYPVTFSEADAWLTNFLESRFADFGTYEDAIVANEHILNHSLLSPLLNSGLLEVGVTVERILDYGIRESIPLNSLEGLIRQIVGWREFIRGVYETAGGRERTANFWGFERPIPKTFWTASTGIVPIDLTIKKILETGYCHHIERLMVLGNFMVLCEFDPDDVYRWFMEMFIDSYDWVMVPNVYGMSQFADGGLMSTKPYISGSNYLVKMGDFPKGGWQEVWDSLFWRFLDKNRAFFAKNPRLSMLLRTFDRFQPEKKSQLIDRAETFLASLDA
jgi:deoxyribodipyrimidine photolyase-related protein